MRPGLRQQHMAATDPFLSLQQHLDIHPGQALFLPLRGSSLITVGERERTNILPGEVFKPWTLSAAFISTVRRPSTTPSTCRISHLFLSLFMSMCVGKFISVYHRIKMNVCVWVCYLLSSLYNQVCVCVGVCMCECVCYALHVCPCDGVYRCACVVC